MRTLIITVYFRDNKKYRSPTGKSKITAEQQMSAAALFKFLFGTMQFSLLLGQELDMH